MEIEKLAESLNIAQVAESFKASCDAKTQFFNSLRGTLADLAPAILEKSKLDLEDFKRNLTMWEAEHKFENYEFRYNKKYSTAAIFVPVKDIAVGTHDTLTFKGRKADNPDTLVFLVSTPDVGDGKDQPADRTVEIVEDLFIQWLKYGMVH